MFEFHEGSMCIGVLIWIMFRHLGRKERSRFLICVWMGRSWDGMEEGCDAVERDESQQNRHLLKCCCSMSL